MMKFGVTRKINKKFESFFLLISLLVVKVDGICEKYMPGRLQNFQRRSC